MVNYVPDSELRRFGFEHLVSEPQAEPESVQRWRRYLSRAHQQAAEPDPSAQILQQVASDPYEPQQFAAQREQLGLAGRGLIESQQQSGQGDVSRQAAALLFRQQQESPYQVAAREVAAEANGDRQDYARRQWAAAQSIYGFRRPG